MSNLSEQDTLGQSHYGTNFQVKVFTLLLMDKVYVEQIQDVIKEEYFETEAMKWLLRTIMAYFTEYKTIPTPDVLVIKIKEIKSDGLSESVRTLVKEAWSHRESTDLQYVRDSSLEFCVNQNLGKAILECVDDLSGKRYDSIKVRIDKALKSGSDRNIGHLYKQKTMIDQRMSDSARACVPTPWDVINDVTDGGSAGGDLFVLMAPPGIGKTWGLVNVGVHAIKKGLTVVHYSMELNENYVGRRYDANISGIAGQNLKYHKEDVERAVNAIDGNLIIKYYPPQAATVNTLRAHIDKCILQGYKPDIIIVDYADLLRAASSQMKQEIRHALGNIYEDLRALAGEYNIPVWTATQANRSSLESDIIGAEKIAEAFSKMMIADFVVSLSRKVEDKLAGTGRWHVIKNRFGPDGITFPSKINTSTGSIQIYEESTSQGKDVKHQMDKGNEYVRLMLKKKHAELMNIEDDDDADKTGGFEEPTIDSEENSGD